MPAEILPRVQKPDARQDDIERDITRGQCILTDSILPSGEKAGMRGLNNACK